MSSDTASAPISTTEFTDMILGQLPFTPNTQQRLVAGALARFCSSSTPSDSVFILAGYAGTGKTSLIGALVKALTAIRIPVVLLAPTGRAAKVFSTSASYPASTIHRRIYYGATRLLEHSHAVRDNKTPGAVFIVDEASMIGDSSADAEGNPGSGLLEDLLQHVFTGEGCRLILSGDTAQLPPVGTDLSPAMSPARLKEMGLHVSRATLTDTARQQRDSGILRNATLLRRSMLADPLPRPRLLQAGLDDVNVATGEDIIDVIAQCYSRDTPDETILITRSNKRAVAFNLAVRSQILYSEEELCRGERLMIARNNYTYSTKIKDLDFIANGDMAVVTHVNATEQRYGFRFADVTLRLTHHDKEIDCKIILDTLTSEYPSLSREQMEKLAMARMDDPEVNPPGTPDSTRLSRLRSDVYFNALQVKYAYAITCHKAQGSQWRNVIVDLGGIAEDAMGLDFYRWLYTAVSRATRRLYFLNPSIQIDGHKD
ncbi:MAG: AAA family ATPase [Barnesiella sp.]|nr:AAA family ATPase [Bacteroidales bacterium]MBD5249700.1 AAA family ATPase [Barnesiella sp.]